MLKEKSRNNSIKERNYMRKRKEKKNCELSGWQWQKSYLVVTNDKLKISSNTSIKKVHCECLSCDCKKLV